MRDIVNDVEKTETLVRLSVYDGSSWISFGNESDYERLYSVSLNNSLSQTGWSLEARFRNHPDLESLDPYYDGTFKGLLAQYNKCRLEISKNQGSNWYTMFEGYSSETSPERRVDKDDTVIYRPIDPSKRLKDRIIPWDLTNWDSTLSFNNIDAFDAVDDILSAAGFSETINRDISDNPKKTIYGPEPYEPRGESIWSAIQKIFEETGYNVLYRIDDSTGSLDLAIIDPSHDLSTSGRADSEDWDETWIENNFRIFNGDFDRRELTVDDKDVRTKVKVWYQGEDGQDSVVVTADNSSNAIPTSSGTVHRQQIMNEPDNSLIDSKVEALDLAQYALDDLREPSPDVGFDFPFFYPSAQLTDIYRMGGTGDYTVDLFVTSIDHTIDVGRKIGTTSLSGVTDRVIGNRDYWLNKGLDNDEDDRQRGDGRPPHPPKNPPHLEKSIYASQDGQTLANINCRGEHAPEFDIIRYDWKHRIYRDGSWQEWQKDPSTGKDHPSTTLSGLPVGEEFKLQVKYAPVDRQSAETGGISSWSPTGEITLTGDATPPKPPSDATATPAPSAVDVNWTNPTENKTGTKLKDFDHITIFWKFDTSFSGFDTTDESTYDGNSDIGKTNNWTHQVGEGNQKVYYALVAYDRSGNDSAPLLQNSSGDPISATTETAATGDGVDPGVPQNINVVDRISLQEDGSAAGKLKVTWDKVTTNAEGEETEDILGYEINIDGDIVADTESPEQLITGLDVGETYDVKVRTYDYEDRQSSWSSVVTKEITGDDTVPNSPTLEEVSGHPESIYVKWTKPTTNTDTSTISDLNHCLVYHSNTSGIDIDDTNTFKDNDVKKVDGEHWIHKDLQTEVRRYYKITAVDNSGNESLPSSEKSATPNIHIGDHNAPSIPDGLSVESNTIDHQEDGTVYAKVKLDWDDNTESDLKGYEVALSEDNSNWDILNLTESSEFLVKPLKPDTEYYFRINAVDTEQNKSDWTSSVSVTTDKDTTPPSIPSWASESVEEKTDSVVFHWQDVSAVDLSYYEVASDTGNDGTFEHTYTIKATDFTKYGTNGQTFAVKVRAVDTSGNKSSYSTVKTGSPKVITGDGEPPSAPTGLSLSSSLVLQSSGDKSAKIIADWDDNSENDLRGYEVQISEDNVNWDGVGKVRESKITISSLEQGQTKYVRVRAEDIEDKFSGWTTDSIVTEEDDSAPSVPNWSSTSVEEEPAKVVFHWEANTESDLAYYEVTSDKGSDGSFENNYRINATDFTLYGSYSTSYSVKIRAVDTSDNKSGWTSPKSGSPQKIGQIDIDDDAIGGSQIIDGSVDTSQLADLAVSEGKVADTAITAGKIAAHSISANHLTIISHFLSETSTFSGNGSDTVSWTNCDVIYDGSTYDITDSSTTDKYIYWDKSASTSTFQTSSDFPTLGPKDFLVGLNDGGNFIQAWDATAIEGSFIRTGTIDTIQLNASAVTTDILDAEAVNADKIAVGTITATHIDSDTITTNEIKADTLELGDMSFSSDDSYIDQAVLEIGGSVSFVPGYDISDFNTVIRQDAEPTERPSGDPLKAGDVWIDTDDENRQYTWDGNNWSDTYTGADTTGSFVIRQADPPTSRPDGSDLQEGDMWIETDNGNKPYTWDVSASDWIKAYTIIDGGNIVTGSITADQIDADTITLGEVSFSSSDDTTIAQTALEIGGSVSFVPGYDPSQGKATIRSTTAPSSRDNGKDLQVGDMWIDIDGGDKPYTWSGTDWIEAYTIINGGNITTGTIDATNVTVTNLNANNITSGSLSATYIDVESIFAETITVSGVLRDSDSTSFGSGDFYLDGTNGYFSLGSDTSSSYLKWDGSTLTVKGSITADSIKVGGTVGGWDISSDAIEATSTHLYDRHSGVMSAGGSSNRVGITGQSGVPGSGADSVAFWAGNGVEIDSWVDNWSTYEPPVWIKRSGDFKFGDGATNYITWDGTTLDVRGTLNANDITTGTLDAATVDAGTITTGTLDASQATITNIDADNITTGTIGANRISVTDLADIENKLIVSSGVVEIGTGVLSNGGDGIQISGGGLEVEDGSGRTIFNSSGDFLSVPKVSDISDQTVSGTVYSLSTETVFSVSSGTVVVGGFIASHLGDSTEQGNCYMKISDDSGSEYIYQPENINSTGYASRFGHAPESGKPMILYTIPYFQAQGSCTIEIYNPDDYNRYYYGNLQTA